MRRAVSVIHFLFFCVSVFSQEVNTSISYTYLYAGQWDRAIQIYNFSRPFLSEKQPLIIHGTNASVACVWGSSKKFKKGIGFSYRHFRSQAKNENFNSVLNLHIINPAFILRYRQSEKPFPFYFDMEISVAMGRLSRRINNKPMHDDGTAYSAPGIGGNVQVKCGYNMNIKEKLVLSPLVGIGCTPWYYSPNTEAVLNQTKGLTGKNWATILSIHCGFSFLFATKKTE